MQFEYKESRSGDDMLTIKTNQNLIVEFLFSDGEPIHIYVNDYEFASHEEVLYGLFVGIGDQTISIKELSLQALFAYPAIKAEVEREAKEAAAHEREMSCPRATGRI